MSDTQSSGSAFDIDQVPEQLQTHVKEVLNKGQKITPFYDETTLYDIYKQCYSTDQVFLNKLQIISKTRKQQQSEEGQWIQTNKPAPKRNGTTSHSSERYNFLADKQLIARAKRWNDEIKPVRKENYQSKYHEKRDHKHYQQKRSKYQQKVNGEVQHNTKYKQKQQSVVIQQGKKSEIREKFVEKKNEKPVSYTEKKVVAQKSQVSKDSIEKKQTVVKKQQQKKEEKKYEQKKEVKKQQEKKIIKNQQEKTQSEKKKDKKEPQEKKQQYKPKDTSSKEQKKPEQVKAKYQPKPVEPSSPTKTTEKVISEKRIEPQKINLTKGVTEQFQQALKTNPFILKYIKPCEKLQKVSYTRNPDGSISDIKIVMKQ